jgi:hypothetical protein
MHRMGGCRLDSSRLGEGHGRLRVETPFSSRGRTTFTNITLLHELNEQIVQFVCLFVCSFPPQHS